MTIENDFLRVSVDPKGAEMHSLVNKLDDIEHLWQGDPAYWNQHAPNLFPVVGQCLNNQIIVDGVAYPMSRHGFARGSDFEVYEQEADQIKLVLGHSPKTLPSFPFKFRFEVIFELIENTVATTYKMINEDEKTLFFSVGGHPAFNAPFFARDAYEDYYIETELSEVFERALLNGEGLFNGKTAPFPSGSANKIFLRKDLFDEDALVFKSLQSRTVTLKNTRNHHSITLKFPHFQYLGIWAKGGGPFVCLEPWLGCADTEGHIVDLKDKEGIIALQRGHVHEAAYQIVVGR